MDNRDDQLAPYMAKMIHSYLWMENIPKVREYSSYLKSILSRRPRSIACIPEHHLRRYMQVVTCLEDGIDPKPWRMHNKRSHGHIHIDQKISSEYDIQKHLLNHPELFQSLSGSTPGLIRSEQRVGHGQTDIDFVVNQTAHVFELKFQEADHKVVGQIEKYMRSIGAQIHYEIFHDVIGWVIAPSFSEETVVSLKSIGVRMVTISWN